ncbi:hypothetical protein [Dolichospermum compactum]|uniref:Uncharacterized protein n=1 Tax=Dolichospermum compactum NIES-806 TaxID=1973481 RepID=A0A1Z4V491_9CYAN|nr:hypothetical protein [Dolichospermum compactum]BAZ86360.1 hypothetical protein NIES806_25720 [Dolichospermum compactum NIES-806]
MTLTFDPEVYRKLLSQSQPRVIKTEEENDRLLAVVEDLLSLCIKRKNTFFP